MHLNRFTTQRSSLFECYLGCQRRFFWSSRCSYRIGLARFGNLWLVCIKDSIPPSRKKLAVYPGIKLVTSRTPIHILRSWEYSSYVKKFYLNKHVRLQFVIDFLKRASLKYIIRTVQNIQHSILHIFNSNRHEITRFLGKIIYFVGDITVMINRL